jgi:hypothetical protein
MYFVAHLKVRDPHKKFCGALRIGKYAPHNFSTSMAHRALNSDAPQN